MQRILRALRGDLAGEIFPLGGRTIIGRSGDVDVQLMEKGVSRHHAGLIEDDDHRMVLMDLSSKNGTFVGDERVTKHVLQAGDEIRILGTVFVYEEVAEDNVTLRSLNDLKLLSGPAQEPTGMTARWEDSQTDVMAVACKDPLHALALEKRWRHCPACGGATGE